MVSNVLQISPKKGNLPNWMETPQDVLSLEEYVALLMSVQSPLGPDVMFGCSGASSWPRISCRTGLPRVAGR